MKTSLSKVALAITIFSFAPSAFAALPPYYDSVKKIETVLNSKDVADQVAGRVVAIQVADARTVMVMTEMCQLTVYVDAIVLPTPKPGPTEYQVTSLGAFICE